MIILPVLLNITVKGDLLYFAGVVPEDSEITFKTLSVDCGSDTWVSLLLQVIIANELKHFINFR